jgi:hypothetical protein
VDASLVQRKNREQHGMDLTIKALNGLLDSINKGMDIFIPIAFGVGLLVAVVSYTRDRIQKEGLGKGIFLGASFTVIPVLLAIFILVIPFIIEYLAKNIISSSTIRWVALYLTVVPFWYRLTNKKSGGRGTFFVFLTITTLLIGWWYKRWLGMLFISMPVLFVFYHVVKNVAQIILPANDPESSEEARKKARVFLFYLFGIQFPIQTASLRTGRDFETQIEGGDPTSEIGKPGIILTWSHQVAGLSKGIEFNRVDGPGVVYTEPYEKPIALIDLRTQLRVSTVDTVTRDGMKIPTVVFSAFAVDKDKWPKNSWQEEGWPKAFFPKLKHHFDGHFKIDHPEGSYPYSSSRVRSAINTSGINTTPQTENERREFYWDEWVVQQIEHATRYVISGRSLDELWHPRGNGSGKSALDEMASDLRGLLSGKLTEAGINLYTVRVVNYALESDSPIALQNIKTWSSYWEQRVTEAQADSEIIYREEIEKAHAYAKSVLLSGIAESIEKAREIHEDLPRHVIAQYFVHALEEYIKQQPGLDVAGSKQRLESIKDFLIYNRTEGSE